MQHRLNPIERDILTGAVSDLARLLETEMPSVYGEGSLKSAIRDAADNVVRCEAFRWIREADVELPSTRMAVSRAYANLERLGLVERVAGAFSDKTTHLQITEAGISLAEQLRSKATTDA